MYVYYKHWKRACWRIWTSEFILLLVCLFWDRVSQWSHCPEIHFVEEAGLELTETELPLPPKGWCERRTPHSAFNLWHGVLSFVLSGYSNITHTVAQLTSSLQKLNFCFWLSSARILGASHHTQPVLFYKKKMNLFVVLYMYEVLLAWLAVHHVWVWCPWRSEGVSDLLELELWLATSWCWQLSLGPLQEQQTVLTVEVSLRTHNIFFFRENYFEVKKQNNNFSYENCVKRLWGKFFSILLWLFIYLCEGALVWGSENNSRGLDLSFHYLRIELRS